MNPLFPTIDDFFAQPTGEAAYAVPVNVVANNYRALAAFQNVSSYSLQGVMDTCPRRYQLKKLNAAAGNDKRVSSTTFAFGHAVGDGVATFDKTHDMGKAIWAAFLSWDVDLLEQEVNKKTGKSTGKSFHEAVWALMLYEQFHAENQSLSELEVVQLEAVVAVDFEDGHYYTGHVDELLRNPYTGHYVVKENKTTGMATVDPAQYSNSDQALSYAIVVDSFGASDYAVIYTIYSSSQREWQMHEFVKTGAHKMEWVQDQLFRNANTDNYIGTNMFPRRGSGCYSFFRRCEEYETCTVSAKLRFGQQFSDLPRIKDFNQLKELIKPDFALTLTDILNTQKQKVKTHYES